MKFNFKRGEVYLVRENNPQGSEIKKTRPWLVVGANVLNRARRTVVSIPLSTQAKEIKGLSVKVVIKGISSCAVIDQIRALDKMRFIRYEGTLTRKELESVGKGLNEVLNLEKCT